MSLVAVDVGGGDVSFTFSNSSSKSRSLQQQQQLQLQLDLMSPIIIIIIIPEMATPRSFVVVRSFVVFIVFCELLLPFGVQFELVVFVSLSRFQLTVFRGVLFCIYLV